ARSGCRAHPTPRRRTEPSRPDAPPPPRRVPARARRQPSGDSGAAAVRQARAAPWPGPSAYESRDQPPARLLRGTSARSRLAALSHSPDACMACPGPRFYARIRHNMRAVRVAAGVAVVVAMVAGCGAPKKKGAGPSPFMADEDRLEWAAQEPTFVVVRKACRTLDVYRYGQRIRSYPAVFGDGGTQE